MTLPIVHHPDYLAPLRPDHRFPMSKYGYLRRVLEERGLMAPGSWLAPAPASEGLIAGAHGIAYVRRVFGLSLSPAEIRRIGLPGTERVVRRSRLACAGTLLAARLALEHGLAANTAGGSHHAARDHGAGYCVFNDVAVASAALLGERRVRRIMVIDCDAHQGDGTSAIFSGDDRVFTFSVHGARNFPFRKVGGDLDIGLPDGTEDQTYYDALEAALGRAFAAFTPELVFYNAGVDPHRDDRLGRLSLTDQGLAQRDALVLGKCINRGVPVCIVLGGGYDDDRERLARRHAIVFERAAALSGLN